MPTSKDREFSDRPPLVRRRTHYRMLLPAVDCVSGPTEVFWESVTSDMVLKSEILREGELRAGNVGEQGERGWEMVQLGLVWDMSGYN